MTKTILLWPLCWLMTFQSFAQSTWQYLPDSPKNGNNRIDDVFFINEEEGWCATSFNSIFHTKDGGLTWEKQYQGVNQDYFRCIEFRDSLLGFAGTLTSKFLRTTDGGQTWIDVAGQISPHPDAVCGVAVADDSTVYAVGQWDSPGFFLKSTDEGATWASTDMSAFANGLVDINFISRDTGFVSGKGTAGGTILYTTDGGLTWEEKFNTQHPGDYVWKLQRVTPEVWVASIQSFTSTGHMLKSIDGGQTWTKITAPLGNMQGIGFTTPEHGWVGGYSGGFYETTDGGQNWNFVLFGGNFNRFYFVSPTLGYASGNQIFKFSNDTTTAIGTLPQPYEDPFDFTVSPNPASNQVTVSFDLPRPDAVRISLATADGREVKNLFHRRLDEGQHQFELQLPNVAAGPWLICFQRNVGLHSKPLMIQK